MKQLVYFLAIVFAVLMCSNGALAADESGLSEHSADRLLIATTTSVDATGLLDALKEKFEANNSVDVQWVAVGTGQAMKYGMAGDADLIMVHDRAREDTFMSDGYGLDRRVFGYNYFIIVGPESDPANITGMTASEAFAAIASQAEANPEIQFVSRGDDSGTHSREKAIWKAAGYEYADVNSTPWYSEAGAGMVQTLNMADEKQAYTLCDGSTWLFSKDDHPTLMELVNEGDDLLNVYAVIRINPETFPDVEINTKMAKAWTNFLISNETQDFIATFGVEEFGQPLFYQAQGNAELIGVTVDETVNPVE